MYWPLFQALGKIGHPFAPRVGYLDLDDGKESVVLNCGATERSALTERVNSRCEPGRAATMSSLRRAWVRLPRLLSPGCRGHAGLAMARHWQVRPPAGGVAPLQRFGLRFFSKVDVPTPELGGESITEGTIAEWTAKVGENVKKDQVIATIETDKVTVDVKAPQDGQLLEIKLQVLGPPGEGGAPAAAEPAPAAAAEATPAAAAPAAPKPAPKPAAKAEAPKAASQASTASPPSSPERGERREKMSRMRQAIARNLKESQNTLAMLTTFQEKPALFGYTKAWDKPGARKPLCIARFVEEYKDIFQASHGAKLGFQSPFFLASAYALKQIPALNAYIDNSPLGSDQKRQHRGAGWKVFDVDAHWTNEVVYRDYINIGFAAATPKGLVTPVIKNLETKNLAEVEAEFAKFAGLAKNDKLTMDDITGNTFTITNGGRVSDWALAAESSWGYFDYPALCVGSAMALRKGIVSVAGQEVKVKNTFLDDVLEDSSPESNHGVHLERSTCPNFSRRREAEANSFEAPQELLEPIRAPWPSEMTTMETWHDGGGPPTANVAIRLPPREAPNPLSMSLSGGYAKYVGGTSDAGASTAPEDHQKVLEMQQKLCPAIFEDHATGNCKPCTFFWKPEGCSLACNPVRERSNGSWCPKRARNAGEDRKLQKVMARRQEKAGKSSSKSETKEKAIPSTAPMPAGLIYF
eukprot:g26071.t1